ncbi:MAG: hypothetical protein Q9167_008002 [Letrouitia subvulpina]
MDPFSAIGTTIKLAEFCLRLKDVSSENRVFLNLISCVRKDLNEALRERREKGPTLQSMPEKKAWVDEKIQDTQTALNNIGRLVEDARIDEQHGKPVTLKHRFDWVLSNHQKFVTQEHALAAYHRSLLGAITAMQNLPISTSSTLPPPTYNMSMEQEAHNLAHNLEPEIPLKSPFRRRPGRSVTEASLSQMSKPESDLQSLHLPTIEPSIDDAWAESLLRVSSIDPEQSLALSPAESSFSTDSFNSLHHSLHSKSTPTLSSATFSSPSSPLYPSQLPYTDDNKNIEGKEDPPIALSDSAIQKGQIAEFPTIGESKERSLLQERRDRARARFATNQMS